VPKVPLQFLGANVVPLLLNETCAQAGACR